MSQQSKFQDVVAGEAADQAVETIRLMSRRQRRPARREIFCPGHPETRLLSVSPKHHLYLTETGPLILRGLSKRRADELLSAYRQVLPLTDEWLECFWCEQCGSSFWWHVKRLDRQKHVLSDVPASLWEQATGVVRPDGNPTVSQFTRQQARATGVLGKRQYRFL
jgi:hypothetical protein